MMSSSESEEKTKANSVSETFSEYLSVVKPTDSAFISDLGCILRDIKNDYDNAINAFSKVIEFEPEQMAAYGYRGEAYLRKNDYDNAFQDFTRVIKSNLEPKQLQDAYVRRSIIYQLKKDNENADADFSKSIELGLEESEAYASRALVYMQKKDYDQALADYTNAINIEQENPDLYIGRAWTHWGLTKGDVTLQDFSKALALDLSKESVIEFLEGPLHEISNSFLPGEDNYGNFPSGFPLSKRLLELYNDIIEKYPDLPDGHLHRGIYYMSINDYVNAEKDFSTFLRFNGDNVFILFLQGVCYDKLNNRPQATKQFQFIAQQGVIECIKKIKSDLAKYPPINNDIDFNVFLSVVGQTTSIEETLLAFILFFNLATLLDKKDRDLSQGLLSMAKYLDALNTNSDAVADSLTEKIIRVVFNNYPGYTRSPKAVLVEQGRVLFNINAKLAIMEYIVSQVKVLDWGEIYDSIPYEQADGFYYRFHERDINQYKNIMNIPVVFSKQLQYRLIEVTTKQEQEKDEARIDERNKVIADLSHSIKNLISTIIDPLENLNKDQKFRPETIQNALRGANLVREIVNAMNLSFKGSLDDFYHDATHNTGKDSIDLEALVIESLKYSVGNMFDGKYFSNFVQKYFPTREVFNDAKAEWASISQRTGKKDLLSFLGKYFFTIKVSTGTASNYMLGNEKGSAIKLLILFQELIFNAVKYSAFVGKEVRSLTIDLAVNPDKVSLRVANRFRSNLATKTSGIGHIIIDNFARHLLEAQLDIRQVDDLYSVEIEFNNLWGQKNENLVRGG